MAFSPKVDKRFAQAVRSSGLVRDEELDRAIRFQAEAARLGRELPLDRILLKFKLLDRDQILGLWRALRYYSWRKEDKFYVKLAVQSKILTPALGKACLKEQKQAYKYEDQLVRVNEIARQRGYLKSGQDRAIIAAMQKLRAVTVRPVGDDVAAEPGERPSPGAARKGSGDEWREEARQKDLDSLREHVTASGSEVGGLSDEDLDALWDEADLDDVELDSQAVEIAGAQLDDLLVDDDSDDDIFRP